METLEFRPYMSTLRELAVTLDRLTDVEKAKIDAVQTDDLDKLNECMRKEQALGLALRGIDLKRQNALSELGLEHVSLNDLSSHAPKDYREEVHKVVEDLRQRYQLFRGTFDAAQNLLECNLHKVERILEDLGVEREPHISFDDPPRATPPEQMRSDFRA